MSPVRRPRFRADRDPVWEWQPPAQMTTGPDASKSQRLESLTGPELEAAANEVRRFNEALAAAHEPWLAAMATECPAHHKPIGRYCFYTRGGAVRGVCMERVHRGLVKQAKRARYVA